MGNKKTKLLLLVIVVLLTAVFVGVLLFNSILVKQPLPAPIKYEDIKEADSVLMKASPVDVPDSQENEQLVSEVNLAVPFSPQAPHANWDQPYQDACEEAAVIMVDHYLNGASLSVNQMDSEILKMVAWENSFFGSAKDTNIAETTQLVNNYYPNLQARAVYDITVQDIQKELGQGKAVVVLANGQLLGNPYYTQPGPEKHALVIKGFTNGKFITNDPGTRRGADFVYTTKKLFGAIVDYDGNKAGTGKKAMIIIGSN